MKCSTAAQQRVMVKWPTPCSLVCLLGEERGRKEEERGRKEEERGRKEEERGSQHMEERGADPSARLREMTDI